MAGAVSLLSVIGGAAVAYLSERFPTRVETLESIAGVMMIGGLALIGYSLPVIL